MSDIDNKQDTVIEKQETAKEQKVQLDKEYFDNLYKDNQTEFEKAVLESEAVKKVMSRWKDSHVSQGINTYKENNVPGIVAKAIEDARADWEKSVKLSGEDKIRAELKAEIATERKAREKAEMKAKASETVSKLNIKLGKLTIDDLISDNQETTNERINRLYETQQELIKETADKIQKSFIKENNYIPPAGENEAVPFGGDEKAMAAAIKAGKFPASGLQFQEAWEKIQKHKKGLK